MKIPLLLIILMSTMTALQYTYSPISFCAETCGVPTTIVSGGSGPSTSGEFETCMVGQINDMNGKCQTILIVIPNKIDANLQLGWVKEYNISIRNIAKPLHVTIRSNAAWITLSNLQLDMGTNETKIIRAIVKYNNESDIGYIDFFAENLYAGRIAVQQGTDLEIATAGPGVEPLITILLSLVVVVLFGAYYFMNPPSKK